MTNCAGSLAALAIVCFGHAHGSTLIVVPVGLAVAATNRLVDVRNSSPRLDAHAGHEGRQTGFFLA